MIGKYERAFYASQYASMAPLLEHYGVGLWMPEVGGQVDWHAEEHEQTMLALGLSSKREITRTRIRVRTAMATQTRGFNVSEDRHNPLPHIALSTTALKSAYRKMVSMATYPATELRKLQALGGLEWYRRGPSRCAF